MIDTASDARPTRALALPLGLFALAILYGGMTCIAGVLGSKQVGLGTLPGVGPLAVEAGIFPFLLLVSLSSAVAELYGRGTADKLVRFGFVPLITAIALTYIVLQLPTDPGMYEPAKEAFPIILGQSGRLMAAGIIAYGVSMSLNVFIFAKLSRGSAKLVAVRAAIASTLSQIVDTLIFITVAFYGVRPIADLIIGQAIAKVILSIVMVPLLIMLLVSIGRRLDARPTPLQS
ncbi:MAG: queuosine precursor transporter [Sphingomonas bacterium]|nr:queuosine precursor transporter [Sphingomonas bacterium]